MNDFTHPRRLIAHVIVDDKFIDTALRQFDEVSPNISCPILIGKSRKLGYVKRTDVRFYSFIQAKRFFESDDCAAVVFHSLTEENIPLLEYVPPTKKVFWLGWGYDYYDRLLSGEYPSGLLLPETKKIMRKSSPFSRFKSLVHASKRTIKNIALLRGKNSLNVLSRVDYFSPVLDIEYMMARELNPSFNPKYISWNYGTAEDDLGGSGVVNSSTKINILVGNSAAPENNHIDIFNILSKGIDISGRKIVVPLSYGDPSYRDAVLATGMQLFGNQFVPIIDFISKDEYIAFLDSCGFVFMNHIRQQAMGNIFIMMLKGAKIFMNSRSPAYKWFLAKGAAVGSIDDLIECPDMRSNLFDPLSSESQGKNISITMNHCGRDVQREKTRQLIYFALADAHD